MGPDPAEGAFFKGSWGQIMGTVPAKGAFFRDLSQLWPLASLRHGLLGQRML